MNSPQTVFSEQRVLVARRLPFVAALCSFLAPGSGQIYNKQLEKAVLIWVWYLILGVSGVVLLLLGLLARWLPSRITHPPLSDWVRTNSGAVLACWIAAIAVLWLISVYDALVTAPRINSGQVAIRHPMRWQLIHVLGSQLLGFIPFIGLFLPPGMVAEALDAYKQDRRIDGSKVMREGRTIVIQWVFARILFYAMWFLIGAWLLWWLLRAVS